MESLYKKSDEYATLLNKLKANFQIFKADFDKLFNEVNLLGPLFDYFYLDNQGVEITTNPILIPYKRNYQQDHNVCFGDKKKDYKCPCNPCDHKDYGSIMHMHIKFCKHAIHKCGNCDCKFRGTKVDVTKHMSICNFAKFKCTIHESLTLYI